MRSTMLLAMSLPPSLTNDGVLSSGCIGNLTSYSFLSYECKLFWSSLVSFKSKMFIMRHNNKIFDPIISTIAIYVMNIFPRFKFPAKKLFHDNSVNGTDFTIDTSVLVFSSTLIRMKMVALVRTVLSNFLGWVFDFERSTTVLTSFVHSALQNRTRPNRCFCTCLGCATFTAGRDENKSGGYPRQEGL